MFKKSHYIAFGVVAMLALVLLNLPSRTTSRLKLAIGGLFLPLIGLKSSAQHAAGSDTNSLGVVALQNKQLLRENEELRRQLGWQKQRQWNMKLAKVILRDQANWWAGLQIDLGSRDGIRENMTVVTPEGLVGRIGAVGYTNSKVVLVGDPNCKVSAIVVEANEMGIVGPGRPLDRTIVNMNFISRTLNLKPGQTVVTSELGGLFRKGIPIGKIADSSPMEYDLYTQARVKLEVNLNTLEEVWVLIQ